MHLLVGLGNPESEYANTRHNIGFMAADAISAHAKCPPWKKKFRGLMTAPVSGASFLLLKPQTYMNLSGESVGDAMRFHKLEPKDIIVFHDDLDLKPGQVKIKQGGGAGGHNGIKSIDAHIGPDYWRVRLGIGHPGVKGDVVTDYVLGAFAKADKAWLEPLLDTLASSLDRLLEGRTAEFLARLPKTEQDNVRPDFCFMSNAVEKVRAVLTAAGHPDTITAFPAGTRTAVDAAAAVGCTVAQIAKSIIFRAGDKPVLVIASGVNRVDLGKLAAVLDVPVTNADPAWVRDVTGFAIGGVAPVGHLSPPLVVVDEDLVALDPVWAAAGSPAHAFRTRTQDLIRLTGGRIANVKQS